MTHSSIAVVTRDHKPPISNQRPEVPSQARGAMGEAHEDAFHHGWPAMALLMRDPQHKIVHQQGLMLRERLMRDQSQSL